MENLLILGILIIIGLLMIVALSSTNSKTVSSRPCNELGKPHKWEFKEKILENGEKITITQCAVCGVICGHF